MGESDVELRFVKANPCGNTTVFILDDVPKGSYGAVAGMAMDAAYLAAEQVGFLAPAQEDTALLHLQMSGGEFCGNAVLALGAWAVREGLAAPSHAFSLTCSGVDKPLRYTAEKMADGRFSVRGEMPSVSSCRDVVLKAGERHFSGTLVAFPGIAHFCFASEEFPTPEQYEALLSAVAEASGAAAYGVIPYARHGCDSVEIRPYVGVAATGSRVYEKACGSGSLALAIALARQEEPSCFRIVQPGGVIVADPNVPAISTAVYFPCEGRLWLPDGVI